MHNYFSFRGLTRPAVSFHKHIKTQEKLQRLFLSCPVERFVSTVTTFTICAASNAHLGIVICDFGPLKYNWLDLLHPGNVSISYYLYYLMSLNWTVMMELNYFWITLIHLTWHRKFLNISTAEEQGLYCPVDGTFFLISRGNIVDFRELKLQATSALPNGH